MRHYRGISILTATAFLFGAMPATAMAAVPSETPHVLAFDTNGGTFVAPSSTLTEPADPFKTGYRFTGWIDKDGNAFNFDNSAVTEDAVAKATWAANSYSVSLPTKITIANDVDGSNTVSKTIEKDGVTVTYNTSAINNKSKLTVLMDTIGDFFNSRLSGIKNIKVGNGGIVNSSLPTDATATAGDQTGTVDFSQEFKYPGKYTATVKYDISYEEPVNAYYNVTAPAGISGKEYAINSVTDGNGYWDAAAGAHNVTISLNDGWKFTDGSDGSYSVNIPAERTYQSEKIDVAVTPEEYTIEYDKGSTYAVNEMENTQAKFLQQTTLRENQFARRGYSFNGWSFTEGGSAVYENEEAFQYRYTDNIKLYALWDPAIWKITYIANHPANASVKKDASFELMPGNYPTSVNFDTTVTIPNPTKRGYTFKGWAITGMDGVEPNIGGELHEGITEIGTDSIDNATTATEFKNLRSDSETVTFKANWEPITYKVKIIL